MRKFWRIFSQSVSDIILAGGGGDGLSRMRSDGTHYRTFYSYLITPISGELVEIAQKRTS